MRLRLIFLFIILILGSSVFFITQFERISILVFGKEIRIKSNDYQLPLNCDYIGKYNSLFLKFSYKNQIHSLRIKSKDCYLIKNQNELKLLTNKKGDIFIFNIESEKIDMFSSLAIFIILLFCLYRFYIRKLIDDK